MGAVDEKARARLDAVEQWLGDAAWQDNARVAALERRVAALEAEAGAALGKQEVASGANPPAPVSATLDTKACVICGAPVSIAPGQHHWCLYPFEGPAHKGCARARRTTFDCPECEGRGVRWCESCKWTPGVKRTGGYASMACPVCGGGKCESCKGTGKVREE